jgi:hypothetical protein
MLEQQRLVNLTQFNQAHVEPIPPAPRVRVCVRAPSPHTPAHGGGRRARTGGLPPRSPRCLVLVAPMRFCAALLLLLLPASPAAAQEVTEPTLKAAFVYNFAKFTEWPGGALPPQAPISLCVVAAPAVADALEQTVRGREHAGHPFVVVRPAPGAPLRGCQVLYVGALDRPGLDGVLSGLRTAPVLTISDIDGFCRAGGIAELYFDRAQLRFAVDADAAGRAGLQISSRLLTLSRKKP